MFKGKITYKEAGKVEKLELHHTNIFTMLEMMSKFDDLDVLEVLITREVV